MIEKTGGFIVGVLAAAMLAIALTGIASADSGLRASVDRSRAGPGEVVTLTLESEGRGVPDVPDLAPLASDFEVLGTSTGSETRIVNGVRTDTSRWIVTLAPKASGRLVIPALKLGPSTSEPIALEVSDTAIGGASDDLVSAGVALRLDVEPGTRHVQERIPLTLVVADALGLRDARLVEPSGDDFSLTHVGEDRSRVIAGEDGQEVTLTERRYVLEPRRSGSLTVPPMTLEARVPDPSGRRSPFAGSPMSERFGAAFGGSLFDDLFDPGRRVAVRSEPLTIDVLARPEGTSGWFLPAAQVALVDDWTNAPPTLRVGEAATRTIRLIAHGAASEQLPELAFGDVDGARLYVDRTRDGTIDTPDGPAAVREIDISVVPTRAGSLTLPSVDVTWWDTAADDERVATLAARTLEVLPADGASTVPTGAAAGTAAASGTAPASVDTVTDTSPSNVVSRSAGPISSVAASPALLVALPVSIGLLLAIVLHAARRRRRRWIGKRASSTRARTRELASACRANDPERAYRAALAWLRTLDPALTPTSPTLTAAAPHVADELAVLETRLFTARAGAGWDGAALARAVAREAGRLRRAIRDRAERRSGEVLPQLYPA